MKNNRIDALLRRDESTAAGLLQDQPNYGPLEDEIGPLRAQHAANLARAQALETQVLAEDQDDSASVKTTTKSQLLPLAGRLLAALQAYAASAANPNPDLAGRLRFSLNELRKAEEGTFLQLVGLLLSTTDAVPAAELTKREFSAADLTETKRLFERFKAKKDAVRQSDVAGSTARQVLEAALKANAQLIKKISTQLLPYKNSPTKHDVWLRFQGYTKVVLRGGGGSKPSAGTGTR